MICCVCWLVGSFVGVLFINMHWAEHLEMVGDRGSGPVDHQYGKSNGHVIDDVT